MQYKGEKEQGDGLSEFSARHWEQNKANERNKSLTAAAESNKSRPGQVGMLEWGTWEQQKGHRRQARASIQPPGAGGTRPSARGRRREQKSYAVQRKGTSMSGHAVPRVRCRRRVSGSKSSFSDEASDVEGGSKDVSQDGSLGTAGFAEPGRAFDAASGLVSIASFSIALSSNAQFPGGRVDFQVTSQTDVAVGEREIDRDHTSQGPFWVSVGAGGG